MNNLLQKTVTKIRKFLKIHAHLDKLKVRYCKFLLLTLFYKGKLRYFLLFVDH